MLHHHQALERRAEPRLDPGGPRGEPRPAWAQPRGPLPDPPARPGEGRPIEAWRAFEQIHGEEAARTIGVSDFRIEDLELLEREADTLPTINQVELHPLFPQAGLRTWHARHGIATEARGPLAQGKLLDDVTIGRIAGSHGKTRAQVILRWHLQLGNVVIPRSVTPEQIRENIELFDFELSHRAMAAIGDFDRPQAPIA